MFFQVLFGVVIIEPRFNFGALIAFKFATIALEVGQHLWQDARFVYPSQQ